MPDIDTPSIQARDALIEWDNKGTARVIEWHMAHHLSHSEATRYSKSGGACYTWYHEDPPIQVDAVVLDVVRMFLVMVMRDGVDPQEAYDALYRIQEFRDWIPIDMPKPSE